MSFSQSIVTCFKKYLTTSGRATRAEFWWFHLFVYLVAAFFCGLSIMLEEDGILGGLGIFLSKKIMDEMSYEYIDGKNILTMKKRIGDYS